MGAASKIRVKNQLYAGADEVLTLADEHLFTSGNVKG